jgi:formate hydrogenlyase subunit 6/NADH:ubiquinone oxidoreductase subunit I
MDAGPTAKSGYDLALTELENGFLVDVGTEEGWKMLETIDPIQATTAQIEEAAFLIESSRSQMGRHLDTRDLPDLLLNSIDSPQWDRVAERCLSCTNCTMVCPTCFCSTVEEVNDLRGEVSDRVRTWDSCFSLDFAFMHGGGRRPSIKDRYRQWLTHKLGTWKQQFGTLGCVGCGRCITWCPVGIDLTAEVAAIRGNESVGEIKE